MIIKNALSQALLGNNTLQGSFVTASAFALMLLVVSLIKSRKVTLKFPAIN